MSLINERQSKTTHQSSINHSLKIFRCLYRRCPPLPIPNREVKPARADGTAVKCGRVGRCQILSAKAVNQKPFIRMNEGFLGFEQVCYRHTVRWLADRYPTG